MELDKEISEDGLDRKWWAIGAFVFVLVIGIVIFINLNLESDITGEVIDTETSYEKFDEEEFEERVKFCVSPSDYAPYKWYEGDEKKGALFDLVEEMFKRLDMDYSIDVVAWSRCQKEVEDFGESHLYEAFLNGAYTEKRDEVYLHTVATHQTTWGIYYSEKQHPEGLDITNPSELGEKYTACAQRGSPLREEFGITEENVVYAEDFENMFEMMSLGRCDFRPTGYELSLGSRYFTDESLPSDIVTADLEGIKMPPRGYHAIWISRLSPRGDELQAKLNAALDEIKSDGAYDEIFKSYWDKMNTDYVPIGE